MRARTACLRVVSRAMQPILVQQRWFFEHMPFSVSGSSTEGEEVWYEFEKDSTERSQVTNITRIGAGVPQPHATNSCCDDDGAAQPVLGHTSALRGGR